MPIKFNADEVLTMAEDIETSGAKFYRRAAELNKSHSAFLLKLARMEDGHRATFAAMRKRLPPEIRDQTAFDPYLEAALYLRAMADAHGGEGAPAATARLRGRESMAEILRTAIALEEKSIVFYLGLRDLVPEDLGGSAVDDIIREEKGHIVTLAAELKKQPTSA